MDRRWDKSVEFDVEPLDERSPAGNAAEHLEARAIMSELRAGFAFVQSTRRQPGQLAHLRDFVCGEDLDRVRRCARNAIAEGPLALLVSGDRRIV